MNFLLKVLNLIFNNFNLILDKIEFKEIDMNIDVLTEKEAAQLYKISKEHYQILEKKIRFLIKLCGLHWKTNKVQSSTLQNYFESNVLLVYQLKRLVNLTKPTINLLKSLEKKHRLSLNIPMPNIINKMNNRQIVKAYDWLEDRLGYFSTLLIDMI